MAAARILILVIACAGLAVAQPPEGRRTNEATPEWRAKIEVAQEYIGRGDLRAAETYLRHLLKEAEDIDPKSPTTAVVLNNLGLVYEGLGELGKAERQFLRAIQIVGKESGVSAHVAARPINNLATLYLEAGLVDKVERIKLEQLAARLEKDPPNYPDFAITSENVAGLHYCRGRLEKALDWYRRAQAQREAHVGPDAYEMAANLHNQGAICVRRRKYVEAESLLTKSLAIWDKSPDRPNPSRSLAYANLGWVYLRTGRSDQADNLFRKAVELAERDLGPENRRTAEVLANYAAALKVMKRKEEAGLMTSRSRDILQAAEPRALGHTVDMSEFAAFPGPRW